MAEMHDLLDRIELIGGKNAQPSEHPAWDELIICRVEVDLPTWLSKLTGGEKWEVYAENEDDYCVSFAMRESAKSARKVLSKLTPKLASKIAPKFAPKFAEVTLYHNGHAIVDVDGQSLFDGPLTNGQTDCANLTYYHAESGEKITLN